MNLRGRRRVARAAGVGALVLASTLMGAAGPSGAQADCEQYSALGSAAGARTWHTAPGLLLTDVDGNVPGVQAEADSLTGTKAWAGAPYSAAAAENAARASDPNAVPVIAVSSFPTAPEAGRSTPVATIQAKSGPRSSTAEVAAGLPASDQLRAGRSVTSSDASCADDGSVRATADSAVDMLDVAGVLRIASVRSHALALVDATGERRLEGTMAVEGITVLGLPAAITDEGAVAGSSVVPAPDDPVREALADAGITVRTIAAVEDRERGEVHAPGLEIVVTRGVDGVGSGPATTTYVLGRALARASSAASTAAPVDVRPVDGPATSPPLFEVPATGDPAVASGQAAVAPSVRLPSVTETAEQARPRGTVALPTTAVIVSTSNSGPYAAVAVGAFVLLAAWVVFGRLGSAIRWR
jgi:hypothetical protein